MKLKQYPKAAFWQKMVVLRKPMAALASVKKLP